MIFLAKNSLQNGPPRPARGRGGHGRSVSVRCQRFGIGAALRARRARSHPHAAAGMKRSLAPGYERVRLQEEAARPDQAGVPGRLDPAAPGGRPTTFRRAPWRGSCRNRAIVPTIGMVRVQIRIEVAQDRDGASCPWPQQQGRLRLPRPRWRHESPSLPIPGAFLPTGTVFTSGRNGHLLLPGIRHWKRIHTVCLCAR